MHRPRAALLALALLLAACASKAEGMLSRVPRGESAVVLEVRIEEPRRRYMVSEDALARILRLPGVLNAERGSGREQLFVCLRGDLDGAWFERALRDEYRVTVVGEVGRNQGGTGPR
ncbi:MAG: hypothetical protein L6R43_16125 [Planctomycetes bacterium]|nr:hypothetical protein [Planctomycetota bacterium]